MGWLRDRRVIKDDIENHLVEEDDTLTIEQWLEKLPPLDDEPTDQTLTQVFEEFALETGVDPLPAPCVNGIHHVAPGGSLTIEPGQHVACIFTPEPEPKPVVVPQAPAKWEDINHCEQCGTITPGPICLNCSAEAAAEARAEDDQLERERGLCDDQD